MMASGRRSALCVPLFVVCCALPGLKAEASEGMVAYIRGALWGAGKIRLAVVNSSGSVVSDVEIYSGGAHEPKFSPDGTRIAFVRDSDKKLMVMDLDGSNQQVLTACAGDTYPIGSWRHADRIYVNGNYDLLCYSFTSGNTTREIIGSGQKFRELDISVDLKGVHGGMPPIWAFDLNASTDAFAFSECGASISRDGTRVTNCRSDHQGFYIREWGTWNEKNNISTPTSGEALDPQFSGNSNDHVLVNIKSTGDYWNVWLYRISSGTWTEVTSVSVDNSASDFHLGLAEPNVSIDSFTASPSAITEGESSTLSWTTSNASSVSINQGIGAVSADGSTDVSPSSTTTYTLTAEGMGGPVSRSVTVTVTPAPPPDGPGTGILREVWTGVGGGTVADLTSSASYPDSPNSSETASSFEGPTDLADDYGTRFRGYLIAPVSGTYYLWIASDDYSELLLNTSGEEPAGATEIASVSGWTDPHQWDKYLSQKSSGVSLTAGNRYYIEALHKEGTGGDNVCVRWQFPNGAIEEPIPGHRLDPYVENDVRIDSFAASPTTITEGETSTLSWTTTNATSVSINQGIGTVSADGSTDVSPTATTTYTLTAEGTGGPVTGSVTVTVTQPDQVSIDSFTASPGSIISGGTSTLSWTTSHATSVSIDQGIGTVSADGSTDVSPSATTTYTLTAEGAGGPVTQQATVTVGTSGFPIRINCGTNSYTPAGWDDDDAYVTGGSDYNFNGTWDTSAPNAAPESVCQTVRHLDHSYSFPDIPDGTYTVRIHFGDDAAASSRRMDYFIEGVQRLTDFSPGVEAGGGYVALVKDFTVTVSDGNGLQIVCDIGDGGDVFECGIEIIEGGGANQAPTVDAGQDLTVALDSSAFLFGSADDDGLPYGTLSVTWSLVSGPGDASFTEEHNLATNVTFTAVGVYTIRLTASDGDLESYDELQVTVTEEPSITLVSPNGGEVWYVGTTRYVTWTVVNLDNVTMYYSTDGGGGWVDWVPTLMATSPDWCNYPWVIPDVTSAECLVRIRGYKGEAPTQSAGLFEITPVTDADGDGMDDGWELYTFGDMSHDQTTDADGDGRSDYEEFMAGTDPLVSDGGGGSGGSGFGCGLCRPSGLRLAGLLTLVLAALFFALVARLHRFSEGG